jgi:hypothetical protein
MLTLFLIGVGIVLLSKFLTYRPPGYAPQPTQVRPRSRIRMRANGTESGCTCPNCGSDM